MKPADRLPLTEQCHHYQGRHEVPWDIQKQVLDASFESHLFVSQSANYRHRYFSQRYSIFSWYDQGICMTDDAWFGVTPEPVANQVAKDMYDSDAKKTVLIDMFAGAGGNTIAFALSGRWGQIIAVEKDASTLACAQNNADVYGVERPCITWVHGDSLEFLDLLVNRPEELHPDLRVDLAATVVFASPPWGGVGYSSDQVFDLYTMQPYDLRQLHNACYPMDHALYLPRSSDIRQIAKLAPEGEKIEVVQYCMEGASKAMVAYIPAKNIPEKS